MKSPYQINTWILQLISSVSEKNGDSTGFIEFMLQIINESLEELLTNQNVNLTSKDRLDIFKEKIGKSGFNRQEYMRHFKDISTSTASRDLKLAVDSFPHRP